MIYRSNKYGARKVTTASGQTFDSIREYQRFCELNLMQRAGVITDLECQVKFVLIPAQYEEFPRQGKNGKPLKPGRRVIEKECTYIADFVYKQNGQKVVEDAKGCKTKEYRIKKKLMLYVHGIRIQEV